MSNAPAIVVTNLVKTYGDVRAVDGLNLTVERGECFGLLGPNGAGKTTTCEILEGLLAKTSGDVSVLGYHWHSHEKILRQKLGVVLQETRLADKLTVREVVRLFRSFYQEGQDPDAVLASLHLTDKRDAWVSRLSGGQRQRLAVACGLVGDPEILFLDEPTTGLDPQSRRSLWDVILGLKQRGKTVLLTTHYMDEAERLCDRVAVVDKGKVIALGTPQELIHSLGSEHVVDLATSPVLPVELVQALPAVVLCRVDAVANGLTLAVSEPHIALQAIFKLAAEQGATVTRLTTRHATLEDVFVTLTGRHLREG